MSAHGGLSGTARWIRPLAFAAVSAFLTIAGYFRIFNWFAPWDDEGYMLVSLDAFHRGGRLYDEVYTSYGPFYFEMTRPSESTGVLEGRSAPR